MGEDILDEFGLFGMGNDTLSDTILEELLEERVIVINCSILTSILEKAILRIIQWNREDEGLPASKRKPIWVYLQTPGGSVTAGLGLVDVILASKTPVYTLCIGQCASMGFYIFIAGHKRFGFKNSVLMMHDGDLAISNTATKAKDTMEFFDALEGRVKNLVITHTKISPEFYEAIYSKDYYIYANNEGKALGCVDCIIGEDVSIEELFTTTL